MVVITLSWLVAQILEIFSRTSINELFKTQSGKQSSIFHKTAPETVDIKFQGLWEVCLKPVPQTHNWEMERMNRVRVVQWHVAFSPELFQLGRLQSESVCAAQSCPTLCNPIDYIACKAPLSMGFPRQEYWSGLPFSSPGDLPNPRMEARFLPWQADSLPLNYLGSQMCVSPLPIHMLKF